MSESSNLFERRLTYPDPAARRRLDQLVGLDDHIDKLSKILGLLVNPSGLKKWSDQRYPDGNLLLDRVLNRPPLVILAGDVGSGKTELAESIGDSIARQEKIDVTLLPLSLSARGQGKVGEMTQLLSAAFDYAANEAAKLKSAEKARGAIILLVDEADALAQSREAVQMHHEDRSGVNAFIRGIDRLADDRLPAAVIMCTNRLEALDPAVKRRAAELLRFGRPNEEMRRRLLDPGLSSVGFNKTEIDAIVSATGSSKKSAPGFTFSDITQRLIPAIVLSAYPDEIIEPSKALAIANAMPPTPPFKDEA
jgi:AAA+ superfamily predicted ATPase